MVHVVVYNYTETELKEMHMVETLTTLLAHRSKVGAFKTFSVSIEGELHLIYMQQQRSK